MDSGDCNPGKRRIVKTGLIFKRPQGISVKIIRLCLLFFQPLTPETCPRRGPASPGRLRRRQLAGPADGVQREVHHLRRHRQPPERRNVDVYLAAWPSAGVYERIRQQHHLWLQCRRQAHFQDSQRHNVQLRLPGRPADGDDMGQQQAASPDKANWDKNLFAYCDNNPISRKDDGGFSSGPDNFWPATNKGQDVNYAEMAIDAAVGALTNLAAASRASVYTNSCKSGSPASVCRENPEIISSHAGEGFPA